MYLHRVYHFRRSGVKSVARGRAAAFDTGGLPSPLEHGSSPIKRNARSNWTTMPSGTDRTFSDTLDEALAAHLEWERTDYREAVDGIRQGYEDVKAGRTRPAAEFLAEMHGKYGISGGNARIRTRRGGHSGVAVFPPCPAIPESGGFRPWRTRLHRLPLRRPVVRLLPTMPLPLLKCGACSVAASLMCTGFSIKGDTVSILHIRHGPRQSVSPH